MTALQQVPDAPGSVFEVVENLPSIHLDEGANDAGVAAEGIKGVEERVLVQLDPFVKSAVVMEVHFSFA